MILCSSLILAISAACSRLLVRSCSSGLKNAIRNPACAASPSGSGSFLGRTAAVDRSLVFVLKTSSHFWNEVLLPLFSLDTHL